jgi:hypothetical protein
MTYFKLQGDPVEPGENTIPAPAPAEIPAVETEPQAPLPEEIPPSTPIEYPLLMPEPETNPPPWA